MKTSLKKDLRTVYISKYSISNSYLSIAVKLLVVGFLSSPTKAKTILISSWKEIKITRLNMFSSQTVYYILSILYVQH